MNKNTVRLRNTSKSVAVTIAFGQIDPSNISIAPIGSSIAPGQTVDVPIPEDGGCSSMFVWNKKMKLVWCGIIPIGGEIVVDPEKNQVSFGEKEMPFRELPYCPLLSANKERPSNGKLIESFAPLNNMGVKHALDEKIVDTAMSIISKKICKITMIGLVIIIVLMLIFRLFKK